MVALASTKKRVKYVTVKSVEDAIACVNHHQQELSEIGEQVEHQSDGAESDHPHHAREIDTEPSEPYRDEGVVSENVEPDAGMSSIA